MPPRKNIKIRDQDFKSNLGLKEPQNVLEIATRLLNKNSNPFDNPSDFGQKSLKDLMEEESPGVSKKGFVEKSNFVLVRNLKIYQIGISARLNTKRVKTLTCE